MTTTTTSQTCYGQIRRFIYVKGTEQDKTIHYSNCTMGIIMIITNYAREFHLRFVQVVTRKKYRLEIKEITV